MQARQGQHQLIAALGFGQCVQLVDDNALKAREDARRVLVGQQEGKAFRCGQQDMRRVGALAAALGLAGVAGAILDPDRQARAFDRTTQVAADVGGKCLEGGNVKCVQTVMAVCKFSERRQKARKGFATPGGGRSARLTVLNRAPASQLDADAGASLGR